jgi:murein DD-endopeptidase MepM/ murein hydrolase activator NlpD
MALRQPAVSPFVNSRSGMSLVVGKGANPKIISIRPWLTFTLAGLTFVFGAAFIVASLYWIFRDEMLARLINQQNEMQYTYEDRLASLRNQLDRVTSRQLLDQNSIDGKVHELLARQAQLETRAAIVASLAEQAGLSAPRSTTTRSIAPSAPATTGSINSFAPAPQRPSPANDAFDLRAPGQRGPVPLGADARPLKQSEFIGAPAGVAVHAARDFTERTERQQADALAVIERNVRNRAQRLSQVVADIGLDAGRFSSAINAPAKPVSNQGGPLVPIDVNKPGVSFEQRLSSLQFTLRQTDRMNRVISALPITRPMSESFDISSNFGARSDPFTRSLAMHTGIDFRAPTGAPVRATASGKVVEADVVGGYGNMVEIDHGFGLTTRYAHLSVIDVEVGQTVKKGEIVGKVGSTGRSTGPHLHYETRLDGEPTDPMKFIRTGQKHGIQ